MLLHNDNKGSPISTLLTTCLSTSENEFKRTDHFTVSMLWLWNTQTETVVSRIGDGYDGKTTTVSPFILITRYNLKN